MSAVNYARHASLRRYVFLAKNDTPDPAWLGPDWSWWQLPTEVARRIGETPGDACDRTAHKAGWCASCRSKASTALVRSQR